MDDLMTPEQRRAKHREWLASFGFSPDDWRRIRLMASELTDSYAPPALDDLSVPIRVAAVPVADRRRYNGEMLGRIGDAAVLFWPMSNREVETWRRKRR